MDAWLDRTGHSRGPVVSFAQMWDLVQLWYAGRLEAEWRGRSAEEARAILTSVGLVDDFWELG